MTVGIFASNTTHVLGIEECSIGLSAKMFMLKPGSQFRYRTFFLQLRTVVALATT
jgi:hypothetical protein